jgi:tRNA pseudouridine55 synthase
MTSHDVVARARRLLRQKRIGHAGTLDPMATGVLVLCLGKATRLAELVSEGRKTYVTEVTFGRETNTLDASGATTATEKASHLTEAMVGALLDPFRGEVHQVPPMVSARHHEGQRLYTLARQGITVEREARPITIYRLELLAFTPGDEPRARLEVECSTGTYIRVLAQDLGIAAGCGAHMSVLRRTVVGSFRLDESVKLAEVESLLADGRLDSRVLPAAAAVRHWPQRVLCEQESCAIARGEAIDAGVVEGLADQTPVALLGHLGDLAALARLAPAAEGARVLRPYKVFVSPTDTRADTEEVNP